MLIASKEFIKVTFQIASREKRRKNNASLHMLFFKFSDTLIFLYATNTIMVDPFITRRAYLANQQS
jgi:hypothetical protein